jgi:hypothetical protein
MTKYLLLTTALAGLALPALADPTKCVKIDKGGYTAFERGCDLDGSVGNVTVAVKSDDDGGEGPTDPEPVDPEEPTDPVDPEPEPETPTEPSLPDPEVGGGPEPEAPGDGH